MRRTKIIATMGPASESEAVLKDMIEAGADVIRINLSHGSLDSSIEKYRRLRRIEESLGRPLGILVDLPGPKVRAGSFPEGGTPLDEGQRIDRVMLKDLASMENPDLAKAWSFVEYLARTGGVEGQQWLRTACELAPARATFMDKLRAFSEGLYGISGQDVYKVLDDRWRAYAEGQRALAE